MATHYRDLAKQLKQQISQGNYENGARLPAEDRLADQYGVSRPTLRLALEQLQNEGLLDKRHGSGNFVCWPAERLTYPGTARATGCHGLNTNVSTVVKFPRDLGHSMLTLRGCGLVRAAAASPGV